MKRRIGLSLGADLCWPICYEEILERWSPQLNVGGDSIELEVERVSIRPFALAHRKRFDVVLDRVTHWYHTSREWIKKSILMDGLYVLNNPWTIQSMEKQTTYCADDGARAPRPRHLDASAERVRVHTRSGTHSRAVREAIRPSVRSASKSATPTL